MQIDLTANLDGLTVLGAEEKEQIRVPEVSFKLGEFTVEPRREDAARWFGLSNDYVAKTQIEFPDPRLLNPPEVYELVDALITCFRLFKVGYVTAYPVIAVSRPSEPFDSRPFQFSFGSTARQPQGGMAYLLKENEIPELVEFGQHVFPLISTKPHVSLTTPSFRFYNRGVDDMARSDYPLAIVDFVSCMESLVSPSTTELRHRLAELLALITERNPAKRKDVYLKCKDLYDKRSLAVHGESPEDAVRYVNDAQEFAAKMLRFSIGYFSRGLNKKDILADADDLIYGVKCDFPDFALDLIQNRAAFRTRAV